MKTNGIFCVFSFSLENCNFFFIGNWEDNWVYSKAEGKEFGKFELTAGKFFNDAENDKGKQHFIFLKNIFPQNIDLTFQMHIEFCVYLVCKMVVDTLHISFLTISKPQICV